MRVGAKILIIDHNDSFTYNLVQLLEEAGVNEVHVIQISTVRLYNLIDYDAVILSPGPGLPTDNPVIFEILDACMLGPRKIPVLGICLGLQAIVVHFGGKLLNLPEIQHGRQVVVEPVAACPIYRGLEFPLRVGLYHSWAMDRKYEVPELLITGKTKIREQSGIPLQSAPIKSCSEDMKAVEAADHCAGQLSSATGAHADWIVMSVRHLSLPIYGLQFHPESFMTPSGRQIMSNWLELLIVENKPHVGELYNQPFSAGL